MSARAIDQIITIANDEMQRARDALEVEESGRAVAAFQGNIVGYKRLIAHMAAEFGLTQFAIEDLGDAPLKIPDLDDMTLVALRVDIESLKIDPQWSEVLARIDKDTEEMKNYLLFTAEKSRDLDLKQGQWKGETVYTRLFDSAEDEWKRREAKKQEKEKNPVLFEDESA
jgi:hypothetical protein